MAPGLDLHHALQTSAASHPSRELLNEPTVLITAIPRRNAVPIEAPQPRNDLLFSPTSITQEFDALRFDAAAFTQLPKASLSVSTAGQQNIPNSATYSNLLISSPYNNPSHYLDLSTLSTPSRLFAMALTALKPTRPDYATASYTEALNFSAVLEALSDLAATEGYHWPETSFYVVIFRSQLREGIDQDWLYKLDYESHREACESGGLLKYWFGKANGERRNLATCFWHSREDAYKGGLGPWHKKARAAGRELYESIVFSTHRFTALEGGKEFLFEEWVG